MCAGTVPGGRKCHRGTVPVVLMQDIMLIHTHNLCKALRETYY
ncbi:hypothetical protein HMPREF0973_00572 [Prevotella veroralis F0319]|uniref:Uncharacterized protein n=1 Tax=Prevotella veroralis F0319 TaxID=649761 RepID=C9MLU6_9BACT|nr:hypothetical protein HMPREF0973_00572 [Prevotella veroralis F0319]